MLNTFDIHLTQSLLAIAYFCVVVALNILHSILLDSTETKKRIGGTVL